MNRLSTTADTPPLRRMHAVAVADYVDWLARLAGGTRQIVDGATEYVFEPADPEVDECRKLTFDARHPGAALEWLAEHVVADPRGLVARPLDRPLALHEITPQLFQAYTVDGGQMHVAGCRIEDRVFVVCSVPDSDDPTRIWQYVVDDQGHKIAEPLVERLGLLATGPCGGHPPRVSRDQLQHAQQLAQAAVSLAEVERPLHSAVIVLPRWASGAVEFELGDERARVEFADWAADLSPPAICGPQTGVATYHLAATSDGRLAAFEQLAVSDVTGHRLLKHELVTCASTGQLVEPELTRHCPVSGQASLDSAFAVCDTCGESVSRVALAGGTCRCCRELAPLVRDSTQLAELLRQFPRLAKFRNLKTGQSERVVVIQATGLWQRLLVVTDRETAQPVRVATATALSRSWNVANRSDWPRLLGT
jgi:hypothetical protein